MTRTPKYDDFKIQALRDKCAELGLESTGLRRDVVERLERKDRVMEERAREERLREAERLRSRERGSLGGGYQGSSFREPPRETNDRESGRGREGGDWRIRSGDAESARSVSQYAREGPRPDESARRRVSEGFGSDSRHGRLTDGSTTRESLPLRQHSDNNLHLGGELSIMDLSEAELADILFANYIPPQTDGPAFQRRAKIKAEHDVKLDEAKAKKDAAMKRLIAKYNNEVDKLKVERDGKFEELDRELTSKQEKSRLWNPAFTRLKALREARGKLTYIRDFAPQSGYANQYYRTSPTPAAQYPQPDTRPLSPQRSNSVPALQHSQLNARPISPPRSRIPSAAAPLLRKRKAISPLREQYQAQSQDRDHSCERERPTASLSANKRSRSDSYRILPQTSMNSTSTSALASPPSAPYQILSHIPIEASPLAPKLRHLPYIYIPSTPNSDFSEIKDLLASYPSMPENIRIRSDKTGHFVLFDCSMDGEDEAFRCCDYFIWKGKLGGMQVHRMEMRDD
ncbi:hypothetical protein VTL71DRAFT_5094 [Oculimacula yallundae]|uniref:SAP domain-containing protein n=1 Tax=Oculimacula yallundae TaxID=86028 RepID=A0ABR4C1S9_9HELO